MLTHTSFHHQYISSDDSLAHQLAVNLIKKYAEIFYCSFVCCQRNKPSRRTIRENGPWATKTPNGTVDGGGTLVAGGARRLVIVRITFDGTIGERMYVRLLA